MTDSHEVTIESWEEVMVFLGRERSDLLDEIVGVSEEPRR